MAKDQTKDKSGANPSGGGGKPEDKFAKFLKSGKQAENKEPGKEEGKKHRNSGLNADAFIKNANNWFLLNTLSPQIEDNEKKKRFHKDLLMWIMGVFLLLQFIIVAVMVCYAGYHIIDAQIEGNPFQDSTIKIIFTFIGTYITSVIVELIAILNYIVKNVFDTSVAGMVNNFKDNTNENK